MKSLRGLSPVLTWILLTVAVLIAIGQDSVTVPKFARFEIPETDEGLLGDGPIAVEGDRGQMECRRIRIRELDREAFCVPNSASPACYNA